MECSICETTRKTAKQLLKEYEEHNEIDDILNFVNVLAEDN